MNIKEKFKTNEFITLAELTPPKGTHVDPFITHANNAKDCVDAFLIPDIPNAIMRMSALSSACLLLKHELSSIIQLNCRDRNQLAIQGDLLGAYANGFECVMFVEGEDPKLGDHHDAKAIHDISLTELFATAKAMSEGFDMSGSELDGSADFVVGTSIQVTANLNERYKLRNTIMNYMQAGVSFFVTQPIFNFEMLADFYSSVADLKPNIFPTILLIKSLGMARYMDRNVSTIDIPKDMIKQIQKSKDKNNECLNISRQSLASIKEIGLGGVVVSTMGWEHKLSEILS